MFRPEDRRQGLGSRLLQAGLASADRFCAARGIRLRRIYAFCEAVNQPGRAFYEARGFRLAALLTRFYPDCDAALYVLEVGHGGSPAA